LNYETMLFSSEKRPTNVGVSFVNCKAVLHKNSSKQVILLYSGKLVSSGNLRHNQSSIIRLS